MSNNIRTINHNGRLWIDIFKPTRKQLSELQSKYNLHDDDIEATLDEIVIPKTFEHRHYFYAAIHTPEITPLGSYEYHEIDIFFSKKYILTSHVDPINWLNQLFDEATANPKNYFASTVAVFHQIIHHLTKESREATDSLAKRVIDLEKKLMDKPDETRVFDILLTRKSLIEHSSISHPNLVVIKDITESDIISKQNPGFQVSFEHLLAIQDKNIQMINQYSQHINSLTDTMNIISNFRFNDIIRILTITSVSLMPLTLISGILGMNFRSVIFDIPYGFVITILVMILLELAIIQFFKYKKWL